MCQRCANFLTGLHINYILVKILYDSQQKIYFIIDHDLSLDT